MFRALLNWLLAPCLTPSVPERRINAVLASVEDRATACQWGGRAYWQG